MKPGQNLRKSIVEVAHTSLERIGDSLTASQCPKCKSGSLAMRRDPSTMKLENMDHCLFCGQSFWYTDLVDGKLPIIPA